jgi:hypothetical protein
MSRCSSISNFLREVADGNDNDTLSHEQRVKIINFFIDYSTQEDIERLDKDFVKYLFMGYYVYNLLLPGTNEADRESKENTVNDDDEDGEAALEEE